MIKIVRYAQAARAFLRLVRDMRRTDEVFGVVSGLDSTVLMQPVADHLVTQAGGVEAMLAKPRVTTFDLDLLIQLPQGTLGRAYAEHMRGLGLDPYFFPQLPVTSDLDYVRVHLYETHDIWHVVTGFATDVPGELGLQAFYAAQLRVGFLPPVLLAAGMLNAALFDLKDTGARIGAIGDGWRMGQACKPLFGTPWADLWSKPLVDIRRDLGMTPATPTLATPVIAYGAALG